MTPTKKQRERWAMLAERGCCVCGSYDVQIHHALTGAGGRKDHDKVCHFATITTKASRVSTR